VKARRRPPTLNETKNPQMSRMTQMGEACEPPRFRRCYVIVDDLSEGAGSIIQVSADTLDPQGSAAICVICGRVLSVASRLT
jgi:hypothetical protein